MGVYIVTDYMGDKNDLKKEIVFEPRIIMGVYSTEDAAIKSKEIYERAVEEFDLDDFDKANKFYIEPWKVLGSQCHNLSSQCNNLSEDEDIFVCSLCNNETHGFMVDDFGMTVGFGKVVSRCPNCGAEVVRYAEQALKEKFQWVIMQNKRKGQIWLRMKAFVT